MPEQEIVTRDTAVEAALTAGAELPELEPQDAAAAGMEIAARILRADSVDEVFEQGGATPALEVIDVPLIVSGLRWNRSDYEGEGAKVYALIDATRVDSGEELTITCGSRNVMAQLYRLDQLGALSTPVKIVRAERETARGFRPMWLARA